jgi:putative Mg2+ transporter-C (MgtC) family protein
MNKTHIQLGIVLFSLLAFIIYFLYNIHRFLDYEYYFRIFLSGILGFVIGFDRVKRLKPIGFKTYSLISVGGCLVTIISILAVDHFSIPGRTMMDPMRLVAQLLPAVGFVGAGTIWFADNKVKGLTSAALVFFACVVGIGIGSGFYGLTIFTYILITVIIKVGNVLESKMENNQKINDNQDE